MDDELRKPIKWDRPCYKCGSHYCDLSCPDRAKNANANAAPEQEPVANRPSEAERRSLVTECGLEWDEGSETSSNDPFAWATFDGEGSYDLRLYECNEDYRAEYIKRNGDKYSGWVIPLYTAPAPQREWAELEDDEVTEIADRCTDVFGLADLISEALRAKNEVKNHG